MARQRPARTVGGGALAWMAKLNARHPWSHNDHFHSWILANLPEPCRTALDVGCGRGELLAALAPQVGSVIGIDVDQAMRQQARQRCAGLPNVTITGAAWTDGDDTFDLVTMVAVLHHLDVAEALHEVRRRLNPGGRFLAVGLAQPRTPLDRVWDVASMVTNPVIGYVKHPWPSRADGVQPLPFPVRDPTQSFDELRQLLDDVIPGAVMRRRLGFRYTIAWTRPRQARALLVQSREGSGARAAGVVRASDLIPPAARVRAGPAEVADVLTPSYQTSGPSVTSPVFRRRW